MSDEETSPKKSKRSDADIARTARNRERALHLKSARLVTHPTAKSTAESVEKSIIKVQGNKFIDSGGGFLLPPESTKKDDVQIETSNVFDTIELPIKYYDCLDCNERFIASYLRDNFDYNVCDKCRDPDDKHSLITRSDAKNDYLLKDCDFDKREPILKFVSRKNPHNERWSEMKLYLHLQIEKRALEVWESEENLVKQHELRDENREKTKLKKYRKNLKQLRMDVRSSLYDRTSEARHTHKYASETYNEDEDNYTRTCTTCQYTETFEKM